MKQFVIDAFTDRVFAGNPAAVCLLDLWLPDKSMMEIAAENNLSETAFILKIADGIYHLRWFTLAGEIDLCGHATLASAFVVLNFLETDRETVTFETLSGALTVVRRGDLYEMDFPAYELTPTEVTEEMTAALGAEPKEAYLGRDLLCVFEDETVVRSLNPDLEKVKELDGLLLQATARAQQSGFDCVSRTFAPKCNTPEDPVCGSGHCHIVPYWAGQLHNESITAYQASSRGGVLYCRMKGDRVTLAGKAALYSQGEIYLP